MKRESFTRLVKELAIPDAMGHHATEDMTCENCGMYLPATHWRNPKPCPKATGKWQHRRNR